MININREQQMAGRLKKGGRRKDNKTERWEKGAELGEEVKGKIKEHKRREKRDRKWRREQ